MIEEYRFGSITIDGEVYRHDVEVRWTPKESPGGDPTPEGEQSSPRGTAGQACEVLKWWRKEGHVFDIEDINRAVEQKPEVIILGTGAYGTAKVPEETQKFIKNKGIELIIDKTEEAVKTFNIIKGEAEEEEGRERKVIGLFHLTC